MKRTGKNQHRVTNKGGTERLKWRCNCHHEKAGSYRYSHGWNVADREHQGSLRVDDALSESLDRERHGEADVDERLPLACLQGRMKEHRVRVAR